MRYLIVASAVATFALGAPAARAGTVRLEPLNNDYLPNAMSVEYVAAPGERNAITVTATGDSVSVHDASASVTSGAGCDLRDAATVRCIPGPGRFIASGELQLGDGEDCAVAHVPRTARWISTAIMGGPGRDRLDGTDVQGVPAPRSDRASGASLVGGPGDDHLVGGRQGDSLVGGAGRDILLGGRGDDDLIGDGPGARPAADVLRGGPGEDQADYGDRRTPVTADLVRKVGCARGEHDVLVGVEDATGGDAHDVLAGDDRPNVLLGHAPTGYFGGTGDRLVGRGGDDVLLDERRPSSFDGGRGNDRIGAVRIGDRVTCGPGRDRLSPLLGVPPEGEIEFGADCERLDTQVLAYGRLRARGGTATMTIGHQRGRSDACVGRVTVSWRGRTIGKANAQVDRVVRIRLNAFGRQATRRHAVVHVQVHMPCDFEAGRWRQRL